MIIGFLVALLAAVVSFAIGWLWYSKFMFGKVWMGEMGVTVEPTKEEKKKMLMKTLPLHLLGDFVKAWILLFLAANLHANQFYFGAFVWLGFMIPVLLSDVLYGKTSWKMFLIHAGYYLVSILAMGFVFYII
jgi:hypothetical protein